MNFATLPGLAVLNPQGRDPDQTFGEGPGQPAAEQHPPINYHGYAACSGGGFYRTVSLAARHRNVLLLIRRDLGRAVRVLETLKEHGCFVAIAFKEAGAFQVEANLARAGHYEKFRRLAARAELCLSSTPDLIPVYAAVCRNVAYVPTPYPVDFEGWNFARNRSERQDIFLGTRELDVPSRHHLLLLAAVRTLPYRVTVIEPVRGRLTRLVENLGFPADQVRIHSHLSYPEYLRLIAQHRIILQFDSSLVPGQVAGDGTLAGVLTVGGNGAIERLICPSLNGHGKDFSELIELTRRLMIDEPFYRDQLLQMERNARDLISFHAVRAQLAGLFRGL